MIALTALVCAALLAGATLVFSTAAATPAQTRLQGIFLTLVALAGGALGVAAWFRWHSNWFWLCGGLVLLASVPFTLFPARFPHVRTALALLATALIWYGLAGPAD